MPFAHKIYRLIDVPDRTTGQVTPTLALGCKENLGGFGVETNYFETEMRLNDDVKLEI